MEKRFSCFLWQKSIFYTKAYFGSHAWHLRWFDFTPFSIVSVPDRQDSEKHQMRYPLFREVEVDENHLLIKIINPNPQKRHYTLMAPSKEIFELTIEKLEVYMDSHTSTRITPEEKEDLLRRASSSMPAEDFDDSDPYEDLIEFPADGSNIGIAIFIFLYPLRFLMHWTLPDVRQMDEDGNPTGTIGKAFAATFMCLVWLVIGSYAMVASLEALAELMDIPDAVIGFTVSAAGTYERTLDVVDTKATFHLLVFILFSHSSLCSRNLVTKLRRIKSGRREWIWQSSCLERVRFQYLQYHGRAGFTVDALY